MSSSKKGTQDPPPEVLLLPGYPTHHPYIIDIINNTKSSVPYFIPVKQNQMKIANKTTSLTCTSMTEMLF